MQPYYELAYSLASGSLCFFVGTGFSKYLTDGEAPDWKTLLKTCCNSLNDPDFLLEDLFPDDRIIMPLEECASVISLQLKKEGKDIYEVISRELLKLNAKTEPRDIVRSFVSRHPTLKFITTNYDILIEEDVLDGKCTSFCPGFPVNRQRNNNEVYHIHGAIKSPNNMIVTSDDYYRFLHLPNYFSKRLDTLIEEYTVVIIGYSLGDVNLKSMLNSHRYSSRNGINRQHLFFLSRRPVPQHIKDYYDSSYGLRVIDSTEIPDFLQNIGDQYERIHTRVKKAKPAADQVLKEDYKYTDEYLKSKDSFVEILTTISSTGVIVTHPKVIELIENIITRKHGFTRLDGAWEQYAHLAEWLVFLGTIMDLEDKERLKEPYLKAVKTSFSTMSKKMELGKSWDAFKIWRSHWGDLTYKNRKMIRESFGDDSALFELYIFIYT